jgi:hypothetical protein
MQKIINTYYEDELATKQTFCSGLVFELEDGRFLIHGQDGYVSPISEVANRAEYDAWIAKNTGNRPGPAKQGDKT